MCAGARPFPSQAAGTGGVGALRAAQLERLSPTEACRVGRRRLRRLRRAIHRGCAACLCVEHRRVQPRDGGINLSLPRRSGRRRRRPRKL